MPDLKEKRHCFVFCALVAFLIANIFGFQFWDCDVVCCFFVCVFLLVLFSFVFFPSSVHVCDRAGDGAIRNTVTNKTDYYKIYALNEYDPRPGLGLRSRLPAPPPTSPRRRGTVITSPQITVLTFPKRLQEE